MAASNDSTNLSFHVSSDKKVEDEKTNSSSEIVEPYDRRFLDLDITVLDLNKFSNDGLEFRIENEELNKEVHNMLKIYVDSTC